MSKQIVYGQFGQELLVYKQLKNLGYSPEDVFYLDIGASFPVRLSNTYFFYSRGGSGICIEPNPDLAKEHKEVRPNDIFVNMGASDEDAVLEYHRFDNPVLNSFSDNVLEKNKHRHVDSISVSVGTVSSILSSHQIKDNLIHFVSLDVEGLESRILRTFPFELIRPLVFCIESIYTVHEHLRSDVHAIMSSNKYTLLGHTGHDAFYIQSEMVGVQPL